MPGTSLDFFTPSGQAVNSLDQMLAITGDPNIGGASAAGFINPSAGTSFIEPAALNQITAITGLPAPTFVSQINPLFTPTVAPSQNSSLLDTATSLLNTGLKLFGTAAPLFGKPSTTNTPNIISPQPSSYIGAFIPPSGSGQARSFDSTNSFFLPSPKTTQGSQTFIPSGIDANTLLIGGALLIAVILMTRK